MINMAEGRLNKVIFKWAYRISDKRCKNWIWLTSFFKSVKLDKLVQTSVRLNVMECVNMVSDIVIESFLISGRRKLELRREVMI